MGVGAAGEFSVGLEPKYRLPSATWPASAATTSAGKMDMAESFEVGGGDCGRGSPGRGEDGRSDHWQVY
jgi:hypothetical protein